MLLTQLSNYLPQENAYFINSTKPLIAIHQSTDFLAFTTRNNQVILRNTKTSRTISIFKSDNLIEIIIFTNQYLLVVQQGAHQILAFSLKSQKLKSRISGHRSQITQIAYNRHRQIIASISHDECFINSQIKFSKLKVLKCNTSSFSSVSFSLNGDKLATSFKDGSIFVWNPQNWQQKISAVACKNIKIVQGNGPYICTYSQNNIWISDATQKVMKNKQINKFWQGKIKQIIYLNYFIIINTQKDIYLANIIQINDFDFKIEQVKKFQKPSAFITTAYYNSLLLILTSSFKKIQLLQVQSNQLSIQKTQKSPLTNQGLICAGGYSNQNGCFINNNIITSNNYAQTELKVEPISNTCYSQIPSTISEQKLQIFIKKHHSLPDKYRPFGYRYSLKLPISSKNFRQLQRLGRHQCTKLIDLTFKLQNKKLSQALKDVISLLANWSPILAQCQFLPSIAFPYVCIFGDDIFFCFQVLYKLFSGPLSFLFKQYPVANSIYLQQIWEILNNEDTSLANHFTQNNISFTKFCWALFTSFFTTSFNRQGFLAISDLILVKYNSPQLPMFVCLAYLIFNRSRIISSNNEKQIISLCQLQQTIHIPKFISLVNKLHEKYQNKVRYQFNKINNEDHYLQLSYPKQAVLMQANKRKLLTQKIKKAKQQEVYRQKMIQNMQNMMIKAKRQSQRQKIQKQAFKLHCEQQKAISISIPTVDRQKRIVKLQKLIQELTCALQNQHKTKQDIRLIVPSVQNLKNKTNTQLEKIQQKLMKLLTSFKPGETNRKLISQPIPPITTGNANFNGIISSVNSNLANNLWDLKGLNQKNREKMYQNNMLASFN